MCASALPWAASSTLCKLAPAGGIGGGGGGGRGVHLYRAVGFWRSNAGWQAAHKIYKVWAPVDGG